MRAPSDQCSRCGAVTPAGARYCPRCGGELVARCPACTADLPAGAKFCPACGLATTAASSAVRAPAGREGRKVVTALFADVVGSTELGERLDTEDYGRIVGEAVARMVAAVEEFGGSVRDLVGDGVLALFGAPVAHEDDAERAALSGLQILEAIRAYEIETRERWGLEEFSVRVGIETGMAVLGAIGGGKLEYGAMGDVLNTAARLQASAEPGSVLVGSLTRRLIEPIFDWGPARSLRLKGKADPVTAYPLLGTRPVAEQAVPATAARLVGREEELSLAEEALGDLEAGRGGILIVAGEAGIGKTRLLRELHALFDREGTGERRAWLHGRCVSYGESIPYLPLRGMLGDWLGTTGGDDHQVRAVIRGRSDDLLGERADDLTPFLGSLLGLAPSAPEQRALDLISPAERPRRIHEALRALIRALAADGPVVVSLDDLHWADAATLGLLEPLLDCADDAAVLFVLAMRDEARHGSQRITATARRELPHRTRVIGLQPLHGGSARGLLARLVGEGGLPESLEGEILARAGGNPFYLEQLVRSLVDSGTLIRDPGGWRLEAGAELELPQTIERVILARVDRLSSSGQELLRVASVLGREFEGSLLDEVAGSALGAADGLDELLGADLLRKIEGRPRATYRFRHQMIMQAVYRSLLKENRRQLHARAAGGLERLLGERIDEQLGILARHWSAAGEAGRGFEYHRRAADAAARIYARAEAAEHYAAALAEAEKMPEGPDPTLVRELRRKLGMVAMWSGDGEGARRHLEAALEDARAAGDRAGEIDALADLGQSQKGLDLGQGTRWLEEALAIARQFGDPAAEVRVLHRLSICYANGVRLDRGLEASRRALALARDAGSDELVGRALDGLKLNLLSIGDIDALERTCAELEPILRAQGDLQSLEFALLEGAFVHIARADWEAAETRLDEARDLARRIGDRVAEPLLLEAVCQLERARGAPGRALAAGRQAVALAEGRELPYWQAWAAATLGWTLLDLFAVDEAAGVLARGLADAERVGLVDQAIRCTAHLARARLLQGRADDSRELARRAERLLAQTSAPHGESYLLAADAFIALGRVHLAREEPHRARDLVAATAAAARHNGWLEASAAAELVLARCLAAEGEARRARELVSAALVNGGPFPGIASELHAIAAGLAEAAEDVDAAEQHRKQAGAHVEELAAGIGDAELRRGFLEHAPGQRSRAVM